MFNDKNFYTYIMTNKNNSVIYIGISGQIRERINQHKKKYSKGFANKYNLNKLVYYENFEFAYQAIKREKQLKKWNRAWKINLINDFNPNWLDLIERFE